MHERSGDVPIDGDKLDIDYNPSNYTPDTSPSEVSDVDDLSAHLKGISDRFENINLRRIIRSGTADPDNSVGVDGDLYLRQG